MVLDLFQGVHTTALGSAERAGRSPIGAIDRLRLTSRGACNSSMASKDKRLRETQIERERERQRESERERQREREREREREKDRERERQRGGRAGKVLPPLDLPGTCREKRERETERERDTERQ